MSLDVLAITAEITALRRSLATLEEALAANESWRALVQLERRTGEGRPLQVIDARAMKARLESSLALEPAFRSWRRLSDAVAEIERRLQQDAPRHVDWTAIAARAASTTTAEGGAASFRTRFRAKLASAPQPSMADLLTRARGLALPGPEMPVAPAVKSPAPTGSPKHAFAEHAATLVLDRLRADDLARVKRERAAAPEPEHAPVPRVMRLAERLAEAQAEPRSDIADGEAVPEPQAPPAPSSSPEPVGVPATTASSDNVARLAAIETEVDALVLSMGGNASIPPMPLATRSPEAADRAATSLGPAPKAPPESVPMPTSHEPEAQARDRGGSERAEEIDAQAADEPEAEVVIVPGPSPASSPVHTGRGWPPHQAKRSRSRARGPQAFDHSALQGRIEDADVDIRPPGSEPPAIPDAQDPLIAKESAVARFLALLNGRPST